MGQFRSKTLDFKWFLSVVLVPNPAACVPGELPPPKPPLLGLGLDLESLKDRTTEQQNSHQLAWAKLPREICLQWGTLAWANLPEN